MGWRDFVRDTRNGGGSWRADADRARNGEFRMDSNGKIYASGGPMGAVGAGARVLDGVIGLFRGRGRDADNNQPPPPPNQRQASRQQDRGPDIYNPGSGKVTWQRADGSLYQEDVGQAGPRQNVPPSTEQPGQDDVAADQPSRTAREPENLLPPNFSADAPPEGSGGVQGRPAGEPENLLPASYTANAPADGAVSPAGRPPETAQAVQAETSRPPAPASAGGFQMPASGTQMTTALANQLSKEGIIPMTVGQGPDATTVYMKEGHIVGGYDRTAADVDGGRFISREALETKLADSGKSVSQLETVARAATQMATTPAAPAADAAAPAVAPDAPRNVFNTPLQWT